MNKAISVAAILALSAASTEFADHELINLHLEQPRLHRPTFSPLVRDVAHDDEQMVRLSPEILKPHYRTFTPLVADDNDDELVYASALRLDDNDDQYFVAPGLVADDEFYVDDEFFVEQADNELGFFKKIGDGLKKAGQFIVSHPQIITTAAKFLDDNNDDEFYADQQADDEFLIRLDPELPRPRTRIPIMTADDNDDEFAFIKADDNDDEFYADQQADDEFFIRMDPALTRPYTRIPIMAADDNDDEFAFIKADDNDDELYVDDEFFVEQADNELGFFKKIGDGLKKAGQFVVSHPQIITTAAKFLDDNDDEFYVDDEFFVDEQAADEFFAHDAAFIKKAQRQVRASNDALKKASTGAQDSLLSLGGLLKEGKKIQPKRPQPVKTEAQDNMNFLEDFQDNNLSIKDKLKGAANWIGDHPQVITEAAKTYKVLKGKH